MARARRTATSTGGSSGSRSRSTRSRSSSSKTARTPIVSPVVLRSLIGVLLLVLGAVTLIALLLPEAGILKRYLDELVRPLFGQGAWLLAVLLLVAGALVERPPTVGNGWVTV